MLRNTFRQNHGQHHMSCAWKWRI